MLEKYLIENCSPTLACIKTANLFSLSFDDIDILNKSISLWNDLFKDKGVSLILLKAEDNFALVYVCRKKALKNDLLVPGVKELLSEFGYTSTDVEYAIGKLKSRIENYDVFPHEIGVFLGYPIDDVKGFIQNGGAHSKCTGCWKVYCNECEAIKIFAKYNKCRKVYLNLWQTGQRNVIDLTVKTRAN